MGAGGAGPAPMVPAHGGAMGAPAPGGVTRHGPVGPIRNPILVFALGYITCGLYFWYMAYVYANELNAFRQKNDISFVMLLLFIGWLSMPEKVLEAKQMAGIPNPTAPNLIMYLLLWPYFLTADLNEIYQAAGAR